MDLKMSVGGNSVPGYKVSNIVSVTEIGHHEYDNGLVSFNDVLSHARRGSNPEVMTPPRARVPGG
jgi:hypothetical protein